MTQIQGRAQTEGDIKKKVERVKKDIESKKDTMHL